MNIFEELEKKTKRNAGYNDCPIGAEYYDESYEECEMLLPNDVTKAILAAKEKLIKEINFLFLFEPTLKECKKKINEVLGEEK